MRNVLKTELAGLMLSAMLTLAGGAGAVSFSTPDAAACAGDVTIELNGLVKCATTGSTLLSSCAGDVVIDSTGVVRCSAPPVCTLAAAPTSISAGGTSTLTASCTPAATSYVWTTNTGFASNASGGIVSPAATTTYSVQGKNTAGTGAAAQASVTVAASSGSSAPPPPPSSTPNGPPACTLSAADGFILGQILVQASCNPAATSYSWTNTPFASTDASGYIPRPSTTTSYSVVGHNSYGDSSANATYTVTASCTLTASPSSIAQGASSTLTASCSPASTGYNWNGAACAEASPTTTCTVTPGSTTAYTVTGTGTNTATSSPTTVTVVPPSCTLTATPSTIGSGDSSTLTASCSPASTAYNWNGACAAGNTTNTCVVTPAATTAYTVTGTGTNTAISSPTTVTVTQPSCTVTASPSAIAPNASSTLTASCSPAATAYNWHGACAGTANTCVVTPAASTAYTVTGTGTNTATSQATTVTVIVPGSVVNTNYPIDWVTARGHNFNISVNNGQSASFQFTTPNSDYSGSVLKEQSIGSNPVVAYLHISPVQSDFTYPNYAYPTWDGCGMSQGAQISLQYIVESVNSHTWSKCSLLPNTTYYVNIRNEDAGNDASAPTRWSNGGPDTCAPGAPCAILFHIQ